MDRFSVRVFTKSVQVNIDSAFIIPVCEETNSVHFFRYTVSYDKDHVVIDEAQLTVAVTITNKEKTEPTPTPTEVPKKPDNPVKTGDDSPVDWYTMMMLLGLATAAVSGMFYARRRKDTK